MFGEQCVDLVRRPLGEERFTCADVQREASTDGELVAPADTETPPGVARAATAQEAVRGADVVLSLVGGKAALVAAESAAAFLEPGTIYADMNSTSPEVKRSVAAAVGAERFADVTVIGSVPEHGSATGVIVSGSASGRAAELFRALGAPVSDIAGEAGAAATGRWDALTVVKPLNLVGGVGSPPNATAIR